MMAGEKNLLTAYEYNHFNETSGTVGAHKVVPMTDKQSEVFAKYNNLIMYGIIRKNLPEDWMNGRAFCTSSGNCRTLPSGLTVGEASAKIADYIEGGKDALTKVKNKGALSNCLEELQKEIDSGADEPAFAVGVFDCDDLKLINDRYGHDKGDIYLKKAAHIICEVFKHSPVFRMGGDEFAVILENEDYLNHEALLKQFDTSVEEANIAVAEPWEQVHLSKGFAVFASSEDSTVADVMKRAAQLMYENKRERKKQK